MAVDEQRYRLVVLGAGRVGKSSIINRFLSGKFVEAYRPTVEDLHCRTFHVDVSAIQVDILDTAGNLEFPAMRRLSISTAHAYLLVFAVDNRESFAEVRDLWNLIGELRTNRDELPCVIVANKCDIVSCRLMAMEQTDEWARQVGIDPSTSIVEASAKNNDNIRVIFRKLYEQAQQAQLKVAVNNDETPGGCGSPRHLAATTEQRPRSQDPFLKRHFSANAARMAGKRAAASAAAGGSSTSTGTSNGHESGATTNGSSHGGAGLKAEPGVSRSRSLIRRVRKPKVKDAADPNVNDCVIS